MTSISTLNASRAKPDTIISVDAGATLGSIREAADDADRLFPLSLPSEGSCQIGGNISTNAGGVQVLSVLPNFRESGHLS